MYLAFQPIDVSVSQDLDVLASEHAFGERMEHPYIDLLRLYPFLLPPASSLVDLFWHLQTKKASAVSFLENEADY